MNVEKKNSRIGRALIYLFLVIVYSIFTKWIVDRVIGGIAERG